jgi:serine/threonine-protein kinase
VTVPDLVWESEAAGTLEYEGLALGDAEYVPSDLPAGQVVETRPAEGTEVDRGTPVTIVVSTGPAQQAPVQGTPQVVTPEDPTQQQNEDGGDGRGRGRGRGGDSEGGED